MEINKDELLDLVAEILEEDKEKISGETRLIEDLDIDSVMILELMAALGDFYDVDINPTMMKNITTVNSIAEILEKMDEELLSK